MRKTRQISTERLIANSREAADFLVDDLRAKARPEEVGMLFYLRSMGDADGRVYQGTKALAKRFRCSRGRIVRILRSLAEKGLVVNGVSASGGWYYQAAWAHKFRRKATRGAK